MAQRLRFMDAAKGLAVLIIIFYHAMPAGAIKQFLYIATNSSLCMFFFIAGYFFDPQKSVAAADIKKRANALLAPFLIYGIILWLLGTAYLLISEKETLLESIYCLRDYFVGCIWNRSIQNLFSLEYYSLGSRYPFLAPFWFLLTMFFASEISFLTAKKACGSKWKTVVAIIAFLLIGGLVAPFKDYIPYNLHIAVYFSAFMLLGLLSRQFGFPEESLITGHLQYIVGSIAVAISFGLEYAHLYEWGSGLFRGSFGTPEFVGMIVVTLSGMLFTYGIVRIMYRLEMDNLRISEICWIGENSLPFYLLHNFVFFFINIITGLEIGLKNQATDVKANIASAVAACIAVAACSLFVILIKRVRSGADRIRGRVH